ncbi:MAG: ketol-acid reductoisomerase [Coriobacteriia bacterium]|nr:ketol-acid reductoisomerase [Coriobacteriia bacterium]
MQTERKTDAVREPAHIYKEQDCNPEIIANSVVSIIGYGAQGHAQALNLKDSGVHVIVGLRPGSPNRKVAQDAGFEVADIDEATKKGDLIMMLIPDEVQAETYREHIEPYMTSDKTLAFAHGFNILFEKIKPSPDIDVILIAPKGQGHMLRRMFSIGSGVPGLVGVAQDVSGRAWDRAFSYAQAIGCARMGILKTTFAEEATCDLFGEQAVLCGGAMELMRAGFQTLVDAGYQPEIAYFECIHEMKLIVDLVYENGFGDMFKVISNTAEFGGYRTGKTIVTDQTRAAMRACLKDIEDGTFASAWMNECTTPQGKTDFTAERAAHAEGLEEIVGKRLRSAFTPCEKVTIRPQEPQDEREQK